MKSSQQTSTKRTLHKRIERFVRRKFIGLFSHSGKQEIITNSEQRLHLSDSPKILFLRQDKIGDALVSFPIIRAVKEYYPNAQIDIVLGKANATIQQSLSKYISNVLVFNKKRTVASLASFRKYRGQYDVVIDLMDNPSATSTILVKYFKTKYAIGIEKKNSGAYSHLVPLLNRSTVHIVERIAQLLLPLGIDPNTVDLSLEYDITLGEKEEVRKTLFSSTPLGQDESSLLPLIGINISGSSEARYWGETNFKQFIEYVQKVHPKFHGVLFAAPHHRDRLQNIGRNTSFTIAPEVSSFHEFATQMSLCSLIITPDTSVVHLAAAWKTPSVVLFVQSRPDLLPWTPYQSPHKALYAQNSIQEITVQQVINATNELINEKVL